MSEENNCLSCKVSLLPTEITLIDIIDCLEITNCDKATPKSEYLSDAGLAEKTALYFLTPWESSTCSKLYSPVKSPNL